MSTYITSSTFMLVILAMLATRSESTIRQPESRKRCLALILAVAAYVLMDAIFIICHLTPERPVWAWQTASFFFYIAYSMMPFAWHRFVRNFVGNTFRPVTEKLEYIPIVLLLAMILATPFSGALYVITEAGGYQRGPLYLFYSYLNFFYYVEPIFYAVVVCIRKERKKEPYLFHAVGISLVPLLATVINSLVIPAGTIYPFQPFCSVVVALLAYFFMAATESDALQEQQKEAIEAALHQAQEATQRATEASRVKTTFLSNMSHDIRTPMNAVINLTQLAQKEDDITVIRDYLSKMEVSGKFLLGLINDILDMSRIESGELTLNKENLTRSEFINTVETVIDPLMEARHIHFHSELRPGEYTISVDKLRFNQIFFNLLSNAAKFTPEGGDVWFEVDNIEAENNRLKIQFVVRDNGIGMSEEFLQHLFEPFARERSELSDRTQGTGLGLPIVKSLVDAMGGTISVKSELGKGTEFIVRFEVDIVSSDETHKIATAEEVKVDLRGMRILLVEDNEINTYVAQIMLEEVGCVVTTAENGKIAVDLFSSNPADTFDAILMDVRMPVMDGIEATRAIRALPRHDAVTIPIIAMTADAFDEDRKSTLEAGMNYHLAKPVDAQQIYKVLRECMQKKNRLPGE